MYFTSLGPLFLWALYIEKRLYFRYNIRYVGLMHSVHEKAKDGRKEDVV